MDTKLVSNSSRISVESYSQLVERIDRLEKLVLKLIEIAENREDVQIMREAEIEYRSGDAIAFEKLVSEILIEKMFGDKMTA